MRRNVARIGRLILAAALAYLTVGIVWETAFGLALGPSGSADTRSPWQGLLSFLAWFVLPSALLPSAMSDNVSGGMLVTIALLPAITAVMIATHARLVTAAATASGYCRSLPRCS